MPKYTVCIYQETYVDFEVEAENEVDAMEKAMQGEGEIVETTVKESQIEQVTLKTETTFDKVKKTVVALGERGQRNSV